MTRCEWADTDPLMGEYHDKEWGSVLHDDKKLFEFLILEGMQAGLSWLTVLKKRDSYREAFDNFDPVKISRYSQKQVSLLLKNPGIIRNRLKVESVISNAKAYLKLVKEEGSFNGYIWGFVDNCSIQNKWEKLSQIPAQTDKSMIMCKELKKKGFRFVGSTICYAFMQATGMVNDHVISCARYKQVQSGVKRKVAVMKR